MASALEPNELTEAFSKQQFAGSDGKTLRYRMLEPSTDRDPITSNQRYPVVLFFHGAGERGDDNQAQLKHGVTQLAKPEYRHRFPAIVIVPQCPKEKQWVDRPWTEPTGVGTFENQPSETMARVMELLDQVLKRDDVDLTRIYVTGLSMGGYGTWYLAGSQSIDFAAAIAVCGGGDPEWAARYNGMPIWAVHGSADKVVPVSRSREMMSAMIHGGHAGELRYTELPGVQHDSWTVTYARKDIWDWLFAQRRK